MYCAEGSKPAYSRRLALFHNFPTEAGVEQTEWVDVRPMANPIHGGAVEFNLSGATTNYLDLKRTRLYVRVKLFHEDGSSLTQNESVGFVNLPLHSMWSQVDIAVQQQTVTSSVSNNYPYKAYLDMLFKHGTTQKTIDTQSQLFIPDSGNVDDPDAAAGSNLGLYLRTKYSNNSQSVDMEGPIFMDICQQERFMINGVQITLKFWPSRENFFLLSSEEGMRYKIRVEDCILKCCYVKINPGVIVGHAEALAKQPVLYPFRRSDLKCFAIPAGQFHMNIDDVFQGEIPERLIVGLVSSKAYSGMYHLNPFNFQHFHCNFAAFYVDGKSVPSTPLEPNYREGTYVSSYLSLFNSKHIYGEDNQFFINREDYAKGYCLYMFDINTVYDPENNLPLLKKGHTRLQLKFETALQEAVTCVCYAHFPAILKIDAARNVEIK
ncbi:hypothetical protein FSP39_020208 [Pinctada imbricata]|uniref:Uncharacterized protein n=1 Tax=Pinctada imbricata TaxID=66713 RepID=A0AA88XTA6_PINIB|nr:hypothetical protein FSP39_020208 [Pinctada imbricata]